MSVLRLITALLDAYTWIIIIYCLLTWIPSQTGLIGEVKRILGVITDPFLDLFRKLIPPIGGMVDVTPIVALLVLQLVKSLIYRLF